MYIYTDKNTSFENYDSPEAHSKDKKSFNSVHGHSLEAIKDKKKIKGVHIKIVLTREDITQYMTPTAAGTMRAVV